MNCMKNITLLPENSPLFIKIVLIMTMVAFAILVVFLIVAIPLRIIRDKNPEKRAKLDPFLKRIGALNKNA